MVSLVLACAFFALGGQESFICPNTSLIDRFDRISQLMITTDSLHVDTTFSVYFTGKESFESGPKKMVYFANCYCNANDVLLLNSTCANLTRGQLAISVNNDNTSQITSELDSQFRKIQVVLDGHLYLEANVSKFEDEALAVVRSPQCKIFMKIKSILLDTDQNGLGFLNPLNAEYSELTKRVMEEEIERSMSEQVAKLICNKTGAPEICSDVEHNNLGIQGNLSSNLNGSQVALTVCLHRLKPFKPSTVVKPSSENNNETLVNILTCQLLTKPSVKNCIDIISCESVDTTSVPQNQSWGVGHNATLYRLYPILKQPVEGSVGLAVPAGKNSFKTQLLKNMLGYYKV